MTENKDTVRRYARESIEGKSRICPTCGADFVPNGPQKFCSVQCREQAYKIQRGERVCLECGKTFTPRRADQKCCCRECQKKRANRLLRVKTQGAREMQTAAPKKPEVSIRDALRIANEHGLTYGQAVGRGLIK